MLQPSDPSSAPPSRTLTQSPTARQLLVWRLMLAAPAALTGYWLRVSQRPWEGGLARKAARGIPLKFDELIHVQLWWAGAIICGALVLALLTSPWWMKWARPGDSGDLSLLPAPSLEKPGPPSGKIPWRNTHTGWLIGLLLLSLLIRLPRMERGIDRDEQDTVRRSMIGYVKLDAEGRQEGAPVVHPWKMTVWECAQANNPFLFSVAARCTLRTWQACTGAEPWRISLTALRLPALAAGLLAIAALVRLGVMAGSPALGLLAGLLGAVHPMHVEFSTQARGYGMVLLFVPLAMIFAWQALRTGRWKHWLALGGSLLGLLSANPGSIYFAAALGLFLTGFLWLRLFQDRSGIARCGLTRWLLCASMAGLLYLPLILPALPPAVAYLKTMKGPLHGMWVQMTWAWYGGGLCYPPMEITTPWLDSGKTAWDFMRLGYFQTEPLTAIFLLGIVPWLLWNGVRWWWNQPGFRPLLAASLAAPVTAYFFHRSADTPFLYHWYLIYWLPPALLFMAAALQLAGHQSSLRFGSRWWSLGLLLAFFGFFTWLIRSGPGRITWAAAPIPQDEVYQRGRYRWITRPDGVTTRQLLPGKTHRKAADL